MDPHDLHTIGFTLASNIKRNNIAACFEERVGACNA